MAETGQFTVQLMQPNAFEAGSRFIPAAQKVRLLHASIRHHLTREDRWDVAALGTPICQEDMIGGQMMFSIQVLDALHRLGIHMSVDGAESYCYAWRVVGAMLGVDQDHVPRDVAEARQFSDLYMTRHMGPSTEGADLTRQLIDLYEEVVPGTFLDPVVGALIRYLVGDTGADWLEVPRTPWDTLVKAAPACSTSWRRSRTGRRWGPGPWTAWPPHHPVRAVVPHPGTRHALRRPGTPQEGLRRLLRDPAHQALDTAGSDRHGLRRRGA